MRLEQEQRRDPRRIAWRESLAHACQRGLAALLLSAMTLLWAPSGVAAEAESGIRLLAPAHSDLILPWTLNITGNWPDACAPEVERVLVNGSDVRVDVRSHKTVCAPTPTPFSLFAAPAATMGVAMMPAGSYRISVYAAQGLHAPLRLFAFGLVNNTASEAVAAPESGYWWAQADAASGVSPGTGLVIELQGRTLTVSALTYEANGDPVWYLGTGLLQAGIAHVPMLRAEGGSALFAAKAAAPRAASALTLDLEFQSSGRALAWFTRAATDLPNALDIKPVAIARMAFADPPDGHVWQGDWILVPDDPLQAIQRLHFDQLQTQSEQNFRLSDTGSENALSCWRDIQQPSAPPQSCTLLGGNGRTVAQFNAVAIGRLEGVMTDNAHIRLIRLTP